MVTQQNRESPELRNSPLRVLMIDPSLFTAPYDEGITEGLAKNNVKVAWACRGLRLEESSKTIRDRQVEGIFYPGLTGSVKHAGLAAKLIKGLSHAASLIRLWLHVRKARPSIIHFQWTVFPLLDVICIQQIRRFAPVVLTIHDTVPFNGNPTSRLQIVGFDRVAKTVDQIIVHTQKAAATVRGIVQNATPISVVAHGPLGHLHAMKRSVSSDTRWSIVFFGKIQAYKGVDILIEAIALIPVENRCKLRITVAGEVFIDQDFLLQRVRESGIEDCVEFRFWRQTEEEMSELLSSADAFVFPYRQIDASGVFYLVASLNRWLVASDIGVFHEAIEEGTNGSLVPPQDPVSLAKALVLSVGKKPTSFLPVASWDFIGGRTAEIYEDTINRYNR